MDTPPDARQIAEGALRWLDCKVESLPNGMDEFDALSRLARAYLSLLERVTELERELAIPEVSDEHIHSHIVWGNKRRLELESENSDLHQKATALEAEVARLTERVKVLKEALQEVFDWLGDQVQTERVLDLYCGIRDILATTTAPGSTRTSKLGDKLPDAGQEHIQIDDMTFTREEIEWMPWDSVLPHTPTPDASGVTNEEE